MKHPNFKAKRKKKINFNHTATSVFWADAPAVGPTSASCAPAFAAAFNSAFDKPDLPGTGSSAAAALTFALVFGCRTYMRYTII